MPRLLLLLSLMLVALLAQAEQRVALVIGNSAYQHQTALPNPVRDATAIAGKLRELGFGTVELATDLGRDELRRRLISFSDQAAEADWALIYFAGHGIELGGTNYIIPVDAGLKRDKQVRIEAIPLYELLEAVEGAGKLHLVILDACRNNPFLAGMQRSEGVTRAIGRGLARVEPSKGTLVAYAARDGQLAIDGEGANSPYVAALLHHMGTPGLELSLLFRRVRDTVLQQTNGEQEPFTYGSLPGIGLYFKLAEGNLVAPAAAAPTPVDRDEIVWASVMHSKEREDFAFYLRQFPQGRYAAEAGARMEEIGRRARERPVLDPRDREQVTDAATIKEVQARLFELNYEPGPINGRMGKATREAIRNLQTDSNQPPDGEITWGLVKRLRQAGSLEPWGAILYAPSSRQWGMAWGEGSRAAAIAAAQKSCGSGCDKQLTFFKGWCGVFAYAKKGWALSSRSDLEQARQQALAGCLKQAKDCRIIAAVCADGAGQFVLKE